MEVGLIGAGKMGFNLLGNFKNNGIETYCFDLNTTILEDVEKSYNIKTFSDLDKFLDYKTENRVIWLMLPPGKITNSVLEELTNKCHEGDIIIDGGNSNPKDSTHFGEVLQNKGIHFFDVGTSGGTYGALHGASYMIGGDKDKFKEIEHLFAKTSEKDGYLYTGTVGSGHFLKIVHNAILYGYMQSLAEGFEVLEKSDYGYNLEEVSESWSKTSVIRGWLLELAANAFSADPDLEQFTGKTDASKSTNWVMEYAMDKKIPLPVISASLFARFNTQDEEKFSGKVISALRKEVGGNPESK